jgi:hypothetical protein
VKIYVDICGVAAPPIAMATQIITRHRQIQKQAFNLPASTPTHRRPHRRVRIQSTNQAPIVFVCCCDWPSIVRPPHIDSLPSFRPLRIDWLSRVVSLGLCSSPHHPDSSTHQPHQITSSHPSPIPPSLSQPSRNVHLNIRDNDEFAKCDAWRI